MRKVFWQLLCSRDNEEGRLEENRIVKGFFKNFRSTATRINLRIERLIRTAYKLYGYNFQCKNYFAPTHNEIIRYTRRISRRCFVTHCNFVHMVAASFAFTSGMNELVPRSSREKRGRIKWIVPQRGGWFAYTTRWRRVCYCNLLQPP